MSAKPSYQHYVDQHTARKDFNEQFFNEVRDRDKIMLANVEEEVGRNGAKRLLDVCCSTGILLHHLNNRFPQLDLAGLDLGKDLIETARANPNLAGIDFIVGDLLEMAHDEPFDIVTSNNALMFFDDAEYTRSIERIGAAIKPGGALLACDFFHPFDHDLKIVETNEWAEGEFITYHRSMTTAERVLSENGFVDIEFAPFSMQKDLVAEDPYLSSTSYTLRLDDGERLSMRGIILQPFCHLKARKT